MTSRIPHPMVLALCVALLSPALVATLVGPVWAQTTIAPAVLGTGGGESSGAGFRVFDTVGQPVVGPTAEPAFEHDLGYWYAARPYVLNMATAVAITSFAAEFVRDAVCLEWAIGRADGLQGFNVYRALDPNGAFERLNASLLPAALGESYVDRSVKPNTSYWYRLGAVDRDGEFFSTLASVDIPARRTALNPNVPNPFNPSTTVSFFLTESSPVDITIYDAQGAVVRRLLTGRRPFGAHRVVWDGRDNGGRPVSSGVYFARLRAGRETFTRKLTLLK